MCCLRFGPEQCEELALPLRHGDPVSVDLRLQAGENLWCRLLHSRNDLMQRRPAGGTADEPPAHRRRERIHFPNVKVDSEEGVGIGERGSLWMVVCEHVDGAPQSVPRSLIDQNAIDAAGSVEDDPAVRVEADGMLHRVPRVLENGVLHAPHHCTAGRVVAKVGSGAGHLRSLIVREAITPPRRALGRV